MTAATAAPRLCAKTTLIYSRKAIDRALWDLDARLSRSPWESRARRSRVAAERRGPTRRHRRSRGQSGTGTSRLL